jgi:hypothetical protein
MKTRIISFLVVALAITTFAFTLFSFQGGKEPWTQQQLMAPADLAKILSNPKSPQPVVFSIGPQAVIKGSIDIGPTRNKASLDKLKEQLEKMPKDANIVIYCGCCPFDRCPNIRPAFELLNKMQFKNHKLLNLPHNLKADWIDAGYPTND